MVCIALLNTNKDTNNNIESYHDALKRWLSEFTRDASGRRLVWLMWRLTISIVFHYMYIEEHKFKDFNPNKKIEAIVGKGMEKVRSVLNDDALRMYYNLYIWIIDEK